MKKLKKCRECGEALGAEVRDHHYVECGLDNVWLKDLTVYVCPEGHEWIAIPALEGLLRAIAMAILARNERPTSSEVKYLRKYLGLSNEDFARTMGVTESQASRWASGAAEMAPSAENLLRLLVRRGATPDRYPVDEVEYLKGLTHEHAKGKAKKIALRKRADDWQPVAA